MVFLDPRWPRPRRQADIPAVLDERDRRSAVADMIRIGGFADTPALARWAATAEAEPILRRYLILRTMPAPTDYFAFDLAEVEREIADQDALAADIEARFG